MPNPVIVLPGYYGSLLLDAVSQRKVWLTIESILHSGEVLDAIRLDTGDPDRIVAGGILEEIELIGRWSPNVYKGLLIFLRSLGRDVVPFGVDWRRTLDFTVDNLHLVIQRARAEAGSERVDVIAHSHGGLVARAYMSRFPDTHLIENFITLGTPHKGMLETFKAMVDGISFFGFSPSHIAKVARTFPSAYELLPADPRDGLFRWDAIDADPFLQRGWMVSGVSSAELDRAAVVVRALPRTIPVKTTLIFGTHRPTLSQATGAPAKKLKFQELANGDGTVPTVSASGAGIDSAVSIKRFAIPYGVHSHLFDFAPAQRILRNVLLDRPMPHLAFGFEAPTYVPGKPFGVAVDVRDADGNSIDDADVRIRLTGAGTMEFRLPKAPHDFFGELPMPNRQVHWQYRLTVETPRLAFEPQVGILFAANHS
jgi:pimeloyl-ACP methyl ester carboxylesterase